MFPGLWNVYEAPWDPRFQRKLSPAPWVHMISCGGCMGMRAFAEWGWLPSSATLHLTLWDRVSHWNSLIRLDHLTHEPQRAFLSKPPSTVHITNVHSHMWVSCGFWGSASALHSCLASVSVFPPQIHGGKGTDGISLAHRWLVPQAWTDILITPRLSSLSKGCCDWKNAHMHCCSHTESVVNWKCRYWDLLLLWLWNHERINHNDDRKPKQDSPPE